MRAYKLALEDAGLGGNILTARNESEAQKIITEIKQIDVIITDEGNVEIAGAVQDKIIAIMNL